MTTGRSGPREGARRPPVKRLFERLTPVRTILPKRWGRRLLERDCVDGVPGEHLSATWQTLASTREAVAPVARARRVDLVHTGCLRLGRTHARIRAKGEVGTPRRARIRARRSCGHRACRAAVPCVVAPAPLRHPRKAATGCACGIWCGRLPARLAWRLARRGRSDGRRHDRRPGPRRVPARRPGRADYPLVQSGVKTRPRTRSCSTRSRARARRRPHALRRRHAGSDVQLCRRDRVQPRDGRAHTATKRPGDAQRSPATAGSRSSSGRPPSSLPTRSGPARTSASPSSAQEEAPRAE